MKKIAAFLFFAFWVVRLIGQPNDSILASSMVIDIPSCAIYQNFWDHINIGYYRLNDSLIPDTLVLGLLPNTASKFCYPVPKSNKVISRYGKRGSRFHSGTDIKLSKGDTIVAAFDGKVRLSRSYHGYGYMVGIRHQNGLETIYGHLSKILVKENQWVEAGAPIALGGRTGRATTDHLHFETRILGIPINSQEYINFETGELTANVLYFEKKKRNLRTEMLEQEQYWEPIPFMPSLSNIKVFVK